MAIQPPPPNSAESEIVRSMRHFRAGLIVREDSQLQRMAYAWLNVERSLSAEMEALAFQIVDAQNEGAVITEQLIRRMDRYKSLQADMKREITQLTNGYYFRDISAEQLAFAKTGLEAAQWTIIGNFAGVAPEFHHVPVEAFESYVGMLGNGSPLNKLLNEAYPDAVDGMTRALLEGVSMGMGPVQIAKEMANGMGLGLERVTLIARTEQLRMWRLATEQQYADSGLRGIQRRLAAKDGAVCMACLILDGEIIPPGEPVDDHPRGRCTSIFQVEGAPEIQWQKGQEWFMNQAEDRQRDMMGNSTFELWKAGRIDLRDLATRVDNAEWGSSPQVRSFKSLMQIAKPEGSVLPPDPIPPLPPPPVGRLPLADQIREIEQQLGRKLTTKEYLELHVRDDMLNRGLDDAKLNFDGPDWKIPATKGNAWGYYSPSNGEITICHEAFIKRGWQTEKQFIDDFLARMSHEIAHAEIDMLPTGELWLNSAFKELSEAAVGKKRWTIPEMFARLHDLSAPTQYARSSMLYFEKRAKWSGSDRLARSLNEYWAEMNFHQTMGTFQSQSMFWQRFYNRVRDELTKQGIGISKP